MNKIHILVLIFLAGPVSSPITCQEGIVGNPVLMFGVCDAINPLFCEPTQFGANSPFNFGDVTSGTIFIEATSYLPSMIVACTSSEPLRWRVNAGAVKSLHMVLVILHNSVQWFLMVPFGTRLVKTGTEDCIN